MIRSIVHPTDLSPEGLPAFEHALRLALLNRSEFTIVHVHEPKQHGRWDSFPGVRETMTRWGFLEPGTEQEEVLSKTGVAVTKAAIGGDDVVDGLTRFLRSRSPDLLVMTSHGRAGLDALFSASVAAEVAHESMLTTLIFGPEARPFIDSETGSYQRLKSVLVPVDHHPAPHAAIHHLDEMAEGLDLRFDYVHVGDEAPTLLNGADGPRLVRKLQGPVVETLLAEAERADLIAMPMVGRHGFLDALRGSMTERIVREATCPVLALPAAG
jgi:nucleotide-binding universal stress UspA family protein